MGKKQLDEWNEFFSKEVESLKKNQMELPEMKNVLQEIFKEWKNGMLGQVLSKRKYAWGFVKFFYFCNEKDLAYTI